MIKRVLLSGGVLLGAAYLGCGGESGTPLTQKPSIVTDRDAVVDTLCPYSQTFKTAQGRAQVLSVLNKGVEDLTVTSLTLSSGTASLVTPVTLPDGGHYAAFLLTENGIVDPSAPADGGIVINNTIKSNKIGFISMFFNSPDAGVSNAKLTIASNATNFPSKEILLQIISPDAGTQGCPP